MALVLADRVRDTTTTTGTGTVTLSGTAPTGYQNFSVIGNANTTYYTINAGSQWEVGIGTYSATGPTLSRDTVLESSNANALVNFSAGTKDVFVTYPSDRAVTTDGVETLTNKTINGSNNTITNVSLTTAVTGTLPVANGGTGVTTSTGTTSVVLSNSPVLVTPTLGVASATSIANGLGAVGTPSYAFTGDLNTGMWSPGADTIAFSTNGTERMRVDSSGNVGIGTSSPDANAKLDVAGTVRSGAGGSDPGTGAVFYLVGSGSFQTVIGGAAFAVNTGANNARTERMRIASDGTTTLNVGGVSSTHSFLYNESGGEIQLVDSTGAGPILLDNSGGLARFYKVGTGAMSIGTTGANYIQYITNSAERMRITDTGNVGIGTSSPGAKLDVSSSTFNIVASRSTGGYAAFQRIAPSGQQAYDFYTINGVEAGRITVDGSNFMAFATGSAAAERMRITSAGNVGIGTTTPLARLFAETPISTGAAFAYAANSNGAYPTGVFGGSFGYNFSAGGAEVDFWNGWTGASGTQGGFAFRRQTGASSQNLLMTIRGDGNVGIGTSSPSYQATVLGLGQETAALTDAGNKGGSIYLQATGITAGSGGAVLFGTTFGNQTPFAAIKGLVTDGSTNTIGDLAFSTRNAPSDTALTERMRVTSAGDVGIGTSAPQAKLDVVGVSLTRTDSSGGSTPLVVRNDSSANNTTKSTGLLFQGVDTVGTGKNTGVVQCGPSDANYVTSYLAFQTRTADALAERMRITDTGNVGIGTSTINARLSLGALVSNKVFALYDDGTNQYGMGIAGSQYRMFAATGANLCFGNYARSTDTFTETVRIDSSGNVGIGTSSLSSGYAGGGPALNVKNGGSVLWPNAAGTWNTTTAGAAITYFGDNNLYIDAKDSAANMIFRVNGDTERMRLAGDGTASFLGLLTGRSSASTDVNTANDTGSFSVRGSSTTIASMSFHRTGAFAINMGLGTDNVFRIGGWSASSNAFQMDSGGNLTMLGNVTAYSDARIKKDVETIDSALDLVSKMRGVRYTRIDTKKRGVGVIAQEMLEVCPEVVQQGVGDDDTLSVAYGNLVGVLIEAVKELTARVAELEGK